MGGRGVEGGRGSICDVVFYVPERSFMYLTVSRSISNKFCNSKVHKREKFFGSDFEFFTIL